MTSFALKSIAPASTAHTNGIAVDINIETKEIQNMMHNRRCTMNCIPEALIIMTNTAINNIHTRSILKYILISILKLIIEPPL